MLFLLTASPMALLVFTAGGLWLWWWTRRPPTLPPGPPLLPLLGNLLSLDTDPRMTFRKLRRKYGDIYSIYIFNKPVIVLNGYNTLKDALVKHADVFSSRPHSFLTDHLLGGRGIVGTSGATWREHRRFAVRTLKELASRSTGLEAKVNQEVSHVLASIENEGGSSFDCKGVVFIAVANIISSVVFGRRYDYSDPLFLKVLGCMEENVASFGSASILNILPVVRYLPGDIFKFKKILANLAFTEREFVQPMINNHLDNYDEDNIHDFTSAYIKEMRHHQGEDTTLSIPDLQASVLDLFGAGSETTATLIRWALALFLNYPDVQENCFREIEENIGTSKRPSMADMPNLPYVEATITELARYANIVPAGVPHAISRDVYFNGYTFPADVMILPVLDSVLHDEALWGDPHNFRPQRFLDEDGQFVKKDEFIPFSLGRRACLGESLARMELFLFITGMVQKYRFVCVSDAVPSLIPVCGIVFSPKPFLVQAVARI
ncbi:cytochrome P450 2D26-like [Haliotis rufescens]|uniref:cytochrome P450 2D26-like n=1 Tax=Haliotis rufescens TaxID=6454 RepID=UPI00201FA1D6|nr:cytochrome P450 2D26-like [Haliotis rufescens]